MLKVKKNRFDIVLRGSVVSVFEGILYMFQNGDLELHALSKDCRYSAYSILIFTFPLQRYVVDFVIIMMYL